ncbi:MAG TPA: hypothetical protein VHJ58_06695 [Vicinamibacterales bacterium]|jgi:hypothetical protein|nr:hypothetical protein [Vicinamibacterales bacterium]
MRYAFAFDALMSTLEGQAYRATNRNDEAVLVSPADSGCQVTRFHDVGDNENERDEVEAIWLACLDGAVFRVRRQANREIQPALAVGLEHERLPYGGVDFALNELSEEELAQLLRALRQLVGIKGDPPAEPMVAFT